jgi:hypothetical protein
MNITVGSQWKFKKRFLIDFPSHASAIATVESVVDDNIGYKWIEISDTTDGALLNVDKNIFLRELEPCNNLQSKIDKIKAAL